MQRAADQIREMQEIWARADAEGRELSQWERKDMEERLLRIRSAQSMERLEGNGGPYNVFSDPRAQRGGAGAGDVFVQSQGYKSIADPAMRGKGWTTPPVEVQRVALSAKGTLLEGSTPGGGPWVQPDVRQGVVDTLFQPLSIAGQLNQQQTSSMTVRYLVEGTVSSGAAPVSEGALKPESTIPFDQVDEPVRKLATFLPISDEMLSDAPSVQSYLNSRLSLFVRITEEDQLLRGNGTSPNLRGIINRTGIQLHNRGTFTNLDAVRQMITKARTSFVEPTFVALHPNQWENIETLKDSTGDYLGDPFRGGPNTLWGVNVVVTNAIGVGTALVGSRDAATIFYNGGVVVQASDSHQDFFQRDLVAIRAELREALAVYRPSAFVMGTAMA